MHGLIGKGYVVENDVCDVAKRLKEIDEGYFLFYNYRLRRYEVHSNKQVGSSLALVVPYKRLDGRTLTLVRATSIERIDEIEKENKRQNSLLQQNRIKKISEKASNVLEAVLSAKE